MKNKKETIINEETNNYNQYFTETSEGLDIEANNINANCITSKNNKFSIDEEGNISCNSITTNNSSNNIDFDKIYPVGSIYLSVNNINPRNLFGGTWTQLTDRFLVGAGGSYDNGSTGGSINHHHALPFGRNYDGNQFFNISNGRYEISNTNLNGNYVSLGTSFTGWGGVRFFTDSANNIPPYLAVYMWKRIS